MKATMKAQWSKVAATLEIIVYLVHFSGKLIFRCESYPAKRFSLGFQGEPDMHFEVKTIGIAGSTKLPSLSNLNAFFEKRLRTSFLERLLLPNRMYFRIPKSE